MCRNYLLKIICLFGMLTILGCSKPTEPESDLNICNVTEHQWYQDILADAEDGSLHKLSTIYRYTYNSDYYFEVENGLFSCMHCYIYDCDGNLADFSNSDGTEEFVENRTDRVVIWRGGDVP